MTAFQPVDFEVREFRNWNLNIRRQVPQAVPSNLEDLVNSIKTAEQAGNKVSVAGSGLSFNDCVLPNQGDNYALIDTCRLNRILYPTPQREPYSFLPRVLNQDIESVLSTSNQQMYRDALNGQLSAVSDRLLHVEGGIKIVQLNAQLDQRGLALPTMGGSDEQSIVGALSTGTHGSTVHLPPIADFVRAIHLVGPGGQQWWLEPSSRAITSPERMATLKGNELVADINIVYDDELFYATLVSFGSAGIIYAIVYEVSDRHAMRYRTQHLTWEEGQQFIQRALIDANSPPHWFIEVIVDPTRRTRLSTCDLTDKPFTPCRATDEAVGHKGFLTGNNLLRQLVGIGGNRALLTKIMPYLMAKNASRFFNIATLRFAKARELRRKTQTVQELWQAIMGIQQIIETDLSGEAVYWEFPKILNFLWQLGIVLDKGRWIVETVPKILLDYLERPERDDVLPSFLALRSANVPFCNPETLQPLCCPSIWEEIFTPNFDRLVESHEYVLPVARCLDFVNAVLQAADEIRFDPNGKALLLALPMRFTQQSRATLAMQRNDGISCHVEVFVVERLNGTLPFLTKVRAIADQFDAIPHWGQLHDSERNFGRLYPDHLKRWRQAMDQLARESNGPLNTFRHSFAIDRDLLSPLA